MEEGGPVRGENRFRCCVRAIIDRGIAHYVTQYGDKTQVVDPATGARKVERHYDLAWRGADRCTVTIHGATGHMRSLPQNDAAIAKWAYVMRELIEARRGRACFRRDLAGCRPVAPRTWSRGRAGVSPDPPLEEVK